MSDSSKTLDRTLQLELVHITEAAAIAAAAMRGRGDERSADEAAVNAMHRELQAVPISGRIVIGEGDREDAPRLYVGEKVGCGNMLVDLAVDPLEGATICAKFLSNALSVAALTLEGGILSVPAIYMDKIAIGPGYEPGLVDLDAGLAENLHAVAKAKGVSVKEITACILDRPRHARLIGEVREAGAAIRLIGDGDIAGVIQSTDPDETGIDIFLGIGGAPEGVLAAAALRCIGGQMQGRLVVTNDEHKRLAASHKIDDHSHKYSLEEMISGDVLFAATGITNGYMVDGVSVRAQTIQTNSIVMHSHSRTSRRVKTVHRL